jgi:hypothetical protein
LRVNFLTWSRRIFSFFITKEYGEYEYRFGDGKMSVNFQAERRMQEEIKEEEL